MAFTYREAEGPANDLEQEIVGSGGAAWAVQADSADPEALRAAIAETVGRFGGLEVLVNNAGTSHHASIEEFPMAEYDRLLAVNVRAIFVAIQAALPHLGAGGRIITIGSVLADRAPISGISVYSLTKAAVAGLPRSLARELGAGCERPVRRAGPLGLFCRAYWASFTRELSHRSPRRRSTESLSVRRDLAQTGALRFRFRLACGKLE